MALGCLPKEKEWPAPKPLSLSRSSPCMTPSAPSPMLWARVCCPSLAPCSQGRASWISVTCHKAVLPVLTPGAGLVGSQVCRCCQAQLPAHISPAMSTPEGGLGIQLHSHSPGLPTALSHMGWALTGDICCSSSAPCSWSGLLTSIWCEWQGLAQTLCSMPQY